MFSIKYLTICFSVVCGYEKEFLEMTKAIKSFVPDAIVTGKDAKEGNMQLNLYYFKETCF